MSSTPIAVTAAVTSALCLGLSAVADQRSTKKVETRGALSPRILLDLARQPLWLLAIGANIVGFALQVVALSFGSLAVVQPLLVFDLVFAVVISRYMRKQANSGQPRRRGGELALFIGVGAVSAGVAGFLAIGQPTAGQTQAGFAALAPLAVGLIVVVGGCLFLASRNQNLRPLALALGCGVCYGVAALSVKLVTAEAGHGPAMLFRNWPIYVLLVTGPVGYILNQDAFQQGTFLAPVQAIITAADPVVSIALGILLLDVRLRATPAAIVGEIVLLLIMVAGIVVTADHSPQVASCTRHRLPAGNPVPSEPAAGPGID